MALEPHLVYSCVFFDLPTLPKNSYWLPTCKTWSIHIKIKIALFFFFLVLWKKKTLAALGLSFCKVSAGRNKNQLLPLGGVRVSQLIQAPPPPVACLMMGLFLLFFVTWPVSLVFRACNSSRSLIHLVMMGLCMPVKYQAVTVRFIQVPGLACSQLQGIWGWFWVNSSLPCYG